MLAPKAKIKMNKQTKNKNKTATHFLEFGAMHRPHQSPLKQTHLYKLDHLLQASNTDWMEKQVVMYLLGALMVVFCVCEKIIYGCSAAMLH